MAAWKVELASYLKIRLLGVESMENAARSVAIASVDLFINDKTMTNDAINHYLALDPQHLSSEYLTKEGSKKRGRFFSELWLAVGLKFKNNQFHKIVEIIELLGKPDLATGNKKSGMIAWLLHSAHSNGIDYDCVVGYDVINECIHGIWSNSVKPECSPARNMQVFDWLKFMIPSESMVDATGGANQRRSD